ncbi:MAG TPA: hypothetical protein VFA93_00220 [Patescibacteria group bacterium]|nr:hypothetical protein [Patescibacteria group bacterium]
MKLPFLKEKEKPQYYLSLIFRSDKIETFVFEQDGKVLKIINEQEEYFPEHLDKTSFEELLEICDKLITQAEDELNLGDELSRTIYGLKDSWTADGKIKKEYLDVLKKLSDSLGLTPIGFLTIPEAVVAFLHKEEGAPPSAILVDAGQNNLTVSLVRAGKVIEQKTSEIHQSPVFTVDTLLKHFETAEILPSKIVILNDEEMVQEFIGHQWSKSLPFLHLPQIVSLPRGAMGRAFALGIADQMGAEVQSFETEPGSLSSEASTSVESTPTGPEQPVIQHHVEPGEAIPSFEQITPETFGFLKGKDVALEETAKEIQEIPEDVKMASERKIAVPAMAFTVGTALKSSFTKMITDWKKVPIRSWFNRIPQGSRGLVGIIAVLAVLLLTTLYYFLFLKANVDIHVNPTTIDKSQDITFSTSSDFKNNIIKGDLQGVSEDGQISADVTGKKETGDKAKGSVTVFNFASTPITLSSSTTLTSSTSAKLQYLTNDPVTVPGHGDTSPGTVSVNITASTFGTEYNLPSGTKFSIGSNSDILAKNDNAFSGGTKKEITAVSKDDLNNLASALIKQMEDKATSDIKTKLSIDKDPLPNFVEENLDKKNFDKNEGDEASKLNLSGTVTYKTIVYNHKEMLEFINSIFGVAQTVDEEDLTISFENIKEKTNGDVTATLKIKAKILPKIDLNDAAKQVSGKSFEKAQEILGKLPQVSGVTIKFSPNFPFPKNLPRIFQNIRIRILPNG